MSFAGGGGEIFTFENAKYYCNLILKLSYHFAVIIEIDFKMVFKLSKNSFFNLFKNGLKMVLKCLLLGKIPTITSIQLH